MMHDALTQMYLRQYAFLMRGRLRISPATAFHFSTLAVSGLVSLAALATLAVALWISSLVLGRPLAPWLLPNWAFVAMAVGIAFVPGMYIDRKMAGLRSIESDLIDLYSTRHQRRLWLLTIGSIIPLAAVIGLCFAAIRAGT